MKLLLIRHGDPDYEHDNLTEAGQREARLLVPRMEREKPDAFYLSPLGRAQATARPTLEKIGASGLVCDWLQEFSVPVQRPDKGGGCSLVPWDWLPQDWLQDEKLLDPVRWRENGVMAAAGVGDAYDRVTEQFDALLSARGYMREGRLYRVKEPNTGILAFFCHFGVSCVLLSHLMNCSPMVLWQGLSMAPASVTTVYTEERRPGTAVFRASAVGDISHLYSEHVPPSFSARFCEIYGNGDRRD